ncbi:MAG: hypothetical protein Q9225_006949 [Loekoesia sp. 1 TL-2023]
MADDGDSLFLPVDEAIDDPLGQLANNSPGRTDMSPFSDRAVIIRPGNIPVTNTAGEIVYRSPEEIYISPYRSDSSPNPLWLEIHEREKRVRARRPNGSFVPRDAYASVRLLLYGHRPHWPINHSRVVTSKDPKPELPSGEYKNAYGCTRCHRWFKRAWNFRRHFSKCVKNNRNPVGLPVNGYTSHRVAERSDNPPDR